MTREETEKAFYDGVPVRYSYWNDDVSYPNIHALRYTRMDSGGVQIINRGEQRAFAPAALYGSRKTAAERRKGRVKNGQFKNMLFVQGGENLRQLCDGIFRRVHKKYENLHTR